MVFSLSILLVLLLDLFSKFVETILGLDLLEKIICIFGVQNGFLTKWSYSHSILLKHWLVQFRRHVLILASKILRTFASIISDLIHDGSVTLSSIVNLYGSYWLMKIHLILSRIVILCKVFILFYLISWFLTRSSRKDVV